MEGNGQSAERDVIVGWLVGEGSANRSWDSYVSDVRHHRTPRLPRLSSTWLQVRNGSTGRAALFGVKMVFVASLWAADSWARSA